MNAIKVNSIVDIFCDSLNIQDNYRLALKELMFNIITKYENAGITEIIDDQEYIFKSPAGKYSVEDFFLNRLLFNVISFEVKNEGSRAFYDQSTKSISLNRQKLVSLLDKYNKYNLSDSAKFLAAKKVVIHEFGHALETKFEKGPNFHFGLRSYKKIYEQLKQNGYTNLNEIYDAEKHNVLKEGLFTNGGMFSSGLNCKDDEYKRYRGTFYLEQSSSKYTGEDNINEIFNESEALEMSNINSQLIYSYPSGNIINIRNIESSNSHITNIADILRILLGDRLFFEGMYLNRSAIINYFNSKFGDIFEKIFRQHFEVKYPNINFFDAWSLFIAGVNEIKYSHEEGAINYSEKCQLKMNLALSLCFDKVIKNNILMGATFDECQNTFMNFTNFVVKNNDKIKNDELAHIQVLKEIKKHIVANFNILPSADFTPMSK